MAIFPQGKTKVLNRATAGEKDVLQALARHLEDDYAVWHNIPIMGSGREPDVVVLHPQRGLLIIEVKDWRRQTILEANPIQVTIRTERGPVGETHPVAQARGYMLELTHQLEKHPELLQKEGKHQGKLLVPWGWGAVLSRIKRADVATDPSFCAVFEPHKVLLQDDLAGTVDSMAFQEKLWGMFNVRWQATLTLPQMNIVRGLLFPELRIGSQGNLPLDSTPSRLVVQDILQVMDLQQEAVARNLGEGHRVIHGPAGSGKTMILVFRAAQLAPAARPDKPILVLCYNRDLAARIETMLRLRGVGPAVQVSTFHKWAMDLIRTYQLGKIRAGKLTAEDYEALTRLACESISASRVPKGQYTAVLIDEAHDLADDWLAAAAQMVDPATKSLLVLYDDAQSIYQRKRRKTSLSRLGIEAPGGRTKVLKINYRNTTEVLALAMECADGILDGGRTEDEMPLVRPESAGRSGPVPAFARFDSGRQEVDRIVRDVVEMVGQGRSPGELAVLARYWNVLDPVRDALEAAGIRCSPPRGEPRREVSGPVVTLTTLHSSKGLEFPVVFVMGLDRLEEAEAQRVEEIRLLYVGMTRATHRLHLSAVGSSKVTRRIEEALGRVQATYA